MPQTRDNGIVTPANSDNYNLTGDLATLADKANVNTVCTSQAQRDALAKFNGRTALRTDTGSLEYTDGTNWYPVAPAVPFGHLGRTAGFQALTGTHITLGMSSQLLRGGVATGTNSLVVPIGGRYDIRVRMYASGSASGNYNAIVQKNGADTSIFLYVPKFDGNDYTGYTAGSLVLSANDTLTLQVWSASTGANTWGTDGYNGTYLELEYRGA